MISWCGFTLTDYKIGVLGTGQVKKGGSYARVRLEKRGVLGTGQVKKRGSLLRHIPVLGIYVSAPPPPPRGVTAHYFSLLPTEVR